jgi:hypothetical protein
MRRHVLGLFGAATSGLVELAWISPGKGSGARLFTLDQVDELAEQAVAWNLEGRNLYLGATLKHPDTAPFARTSDSDAVAAWAVWLDLDEPGSVERAERLARRMPPTLKVTTGTVPHVRQHWWWRLEEPIDDMAALRGQLEAIAGTYGGDAKVVNPGRIMRLAGSIAWPTKPGRVAQLVTLTEGGPTYTADMIARAVPYGAAAPRAAAPAVPAATATPAPASTGSLGVLEAQLDDGREAYMVATIAACLREFIGTTGAAPTADELYEAVWPQYDRKVDWRSRPGRGPEECRQKVEYTLRRFHEGRIRGLRNEEEAVASHEARARPAPSSPPHGAGEEKGRSGGGQEGGARRASLPLLYANEVTAAEPALDFVEGLLVEGGMSVWYGDSNVGKTFCVLDLAMHVALGRPYRGREVDQGGVVYCALEGVAGIRNRVSAWMKHHWVKPADRCDLPLAIVPSAINMLDVEADVPALIEAIKVAAEQLGRPVKLVVIDTLSRALAGGNENSPEDMGALVRASDMVRQACGAHLSFVHHSGKDQARGARGHSLLRAATDTEVEISRGEGAEVSLVKVTKQRELEIGDDMGFRLEVIDLGTNRRGKPLTSCVAVEAGAEEMAELAKSKNTPRAKGKYQPGLFRVLNNLLATEGVAQMVSPKAGMPPQRCVRKAVWQEQCYQDNVIERGKTGRGAWSDSTIAMAAAGLICMTEEWVWR